MKKQQLTLIILSLISFHFYAQKEFNVGDEISFRSDAQAIFHLTTKEYADLSLKDSTEVKDLITKYTYELRKTSYVNAKIKNKAKTAKLKENKANQEHILDIIEDKHLSIFINKGYKHEIVSIELINKTSEKGKELNSKIKEINDAKAEIEQKLLDEKKIGLKKELIQSIVSVSSKNDKTTQKGLEISELLENYENSFSSEIKRSEEKDIEEIEEEEKLYFLKTSGFDEKTELGTKFNNTIYVVTEKKMQELAVVYKTTKEREAELLTSLKEVDSDIMSIGVLTLPFKVRPPRGEKLSFDNDLNLITSFSVRLKKVGKAKFNFQFGTGISSLSLNSQNSEIGDNSTKVAAWTIMTGFMLQYQKAQFGVYTGIDQIQNQENLDWKNNGEPWFAIGLGFEIFSVGLSKLKSDSAQSK